MKKPICSYFSSAKMPRKPLKLGLLLCLFILISSCSSNHRNGREMTEASEIVMTDASEVTTTEASETSFESVDKQLSAEVTNQSGMKTAVSSSAAVVGKQDSIRKFLRTANIHFKTKNVVQAVYAIEDIAIKHDGFVQYSSLRSDRDGVETIKISKDSTLELTYYTIKNEMIIRVPNVELNEMLKDIVEWIDYLDYREIRADDVSLMLLKNQLAQKRERKGAERIESAIDNRGRKLSETIEGEEVRQDRERKADEAIISNFSLQDRIEYSTITLNIYQRQAVKKELIPNEKNIDAYQPGFGSRLLDAFKWGGDAIIEVVLFIVNLWAFILVGILIFVGFKMWKKRQKDEE